MGLKIGLKIGFKKSHVYDPFFRVLSIGLIKGSSQ